MQPLCFPSSGVFWWRCFFRDLLRTSGLTATSRSSHYSPCWPWESHAGQGAAASPDTWSTVAGCLAETRPPSPGPYPSHPHPEYKCIVIVFTKVIISLRWKWLKILRPPGSVCQLFVIEEVNPYIMRLFYESMLYMRWGYCNEVSRSVVSKPTIKK